MAKTYLVIGGGLAGNEALRQLRRREPEAQIVLVSSEQRLPYDRPPLSKTVLKGDATPESLAYDEPGWYQEQGIVCHLGRTVTKLDPAAHTVTLDDGATIAYDRALLATGGRPVVLPVPGHDLAGVHYLRTLDDALALQADAAPGRRAVIIGAGFIGLEVASTLRARGLEVDIVELAPRIWGRFLEPELSEFFQAQLAATGLRFHLGEKLASFVGDQRVREVRCDSGKVLPADLVCVGIGIRPNVELAQDAGLTVDNGVVVNEHLQSSDPDIFGAGDIINYPDPDAKQRLRVEHWSHAKYTGRLAAINLLGGSDAFNNLAYVWSDIGELSLKFFGHTHGHDQVWRRGELDPSGFTLFYLREGRLLAVLALNPPPKELGALRKLVAAHVDLSGRQGQVEDPAVPLKDLA